MQKKYAEDVQFVMVYLREAHPTDGWAMGEASKVADPIDLATRSDVAARCCTELSFDFPVVVDTMDDATAVRWAAWPERLFVIGVDGRIAYTGDSGPFGFNPSRAYGGMNGNKAGVCLESFLDAWLPTHRKRPDLRNIPR